MRHVAAMLRLLGCPPLLLTARGDVVTARIVVSCWPSADAEPPAAAGAGAAAGVAPPATLRNVLVRG